MKTINHSLFVILLMALAISGFSQDTNTAKPENKIQPDPANEVPRPDGLRKISTRSLHDRDFNIHIDHEALERNIEAAIENAMKSVDVTLEKLEINIEPIEVNLNELNTDINPIVVNIPNLNINIDPIEIEIPDMPDLDIDHKSFHWNSYEDNDEDHDEDIDDNDEDHHHLYKNKDKVKIKEKEKDKVKDKSDKEENEKAKGLKKIN